MKHKQLITLGSVLMLAVLLTSACGSNATPKNITVTFDETCTMQGPDTIAAGKDTTIDVIGNILLIMACQLPSMDREMPW